MQRIRVQRHARCIGAMVQVSEEREACAVLFTHHIRDPRYEAPAMSRSGVFRDRHVCFNLGPSTRDMH